MSPAALVAALGKEEWSPDRADFYEVLSSIAAPESGMDIGPGPDVEVQDLTPGSEAA